MSATPSSLRPTVQSGQTQTHLTSHTEHDAPPPYRAPAVQLHSSLHYTRGLERAITQRSTSQNVFRRWLLEISCCAVSAVCMLAIVGNLLYICNRSQSPLVGAILNCNAVLSKVASAALIQPVSEAIGQLKWNWFHGKHSKAMWDFEGFDRASRGPWGSLMLLFRTKGKSLAAVGAALTLFLLAADTFFQQVIVLPQRWVLSSKAAEISKLFRYGYEPGFALNGSRAGSAGIHNHGIIQAVLDTFFLGNGMQPQTYGNGTRAEVPVNWPTSNCTWPVYQSLSVCSTCTNVTDTMKTMLDYGCRNSTIDWEGIILPQRSENVCGWFLNITSPTPLMISGYTATGDVLLTRSVPLVSVLRRRPLYGGSLSFKELGNPILDALIATAADGSPESVYRGDLPNMQECVLAWCVRSFRSSYFQGNYQEEIVDQFLDKAHGPSPWISTSIETPMGKSIQTGYISNVTFNATSAGRDYSAYGLSNATAYSFIAMFDDFFPSFVTTSKKYAGAAHEFWYRLQNEHPTIRRLEATPWFSTHNITQHMEQLGTALTNALRSSYHVAAVPGTAFTNEAYISVRFQWLSFPFVLLLLTCIFLMATIIQTSRFDDMEEVGIWKTSAMPTLIHSLPSHMRHEFMSSSSSKSSSKNAARRLKINFVPKKGWKVSGRPCSPMSPPARGNCLP